MTTQPHGVKDRRAIVTEKQSPFMVDSWLRVLGLRGVIVVLHKWNWARCVGAIGTIALAASSAYAGGAPPSSKAGGPKAFSRLQSLGLQSHKSRKAAGGGGGVGSQPTIIANSGQWDPQAKYLAAGSGVNVWITDAGMVLDFYKERKDATSTDPIKPTLRTGHVVSMGFVGGSTSSVASGSYAQPTGLNFITESGSYSASTYQSAVIRNVYKSVDAYVYFDGASPRYDIVVNPGGDPKAVALKFGGSTKVKVGPTSLYVGTKFGDMQIGGLYAYQLKPDGTKKTVSAAFQDASAGVKFQVGSYDKTKPLYLDPVVYSTLLGGTGSSDETFAVAADADGYAYVTGSTGGFTFPTTLGAYQETPTGATDAYVTKMSKDGSSVIYSTRFGGGDNIIGLGIAVDTTGIVYFGGETAGTHLPVGLSPGVQPATGGGTDGFLAKLSADGKHLLWSTYVGGAGSDVITAVKLDNLGQVHFAGVTKSVNLPVVNAAQGANGGGWDGFVGSINTSGNAYAYLTYLGGSGNDGIGSFFQKVGANWVPVIFHGLAVDPSTGKATVCSTTDSVNFPVTPGAYSTTLKTAPGFFDGAVTSYAANGSIIYSTALGANNDDAAISVGVDSDGNAYVSGYTYSFNFPTTPGVLSRVWNLSQTLYVAKISADGTRLLYSTFVPTSGAPYYPADLAVDVNGYVYVTGLAYDNSLATVNPEHAFNGPPTSDTTNYHGDAFLFVLDDQASSIFYSTYFGGDRVDYANGIAIDAGNSVYMVGDTRSGVNDGAGAARSPFPTTPGAFKTQNPYDNGFPAPAAPENIMMFDGFVVKLKIRPPVEVASIVVTPSSVVGGTTPFPTAVVNLTKAAGPGGSLVTLSSDDPAAVIQPSILIPAGATKSDPITITTQADLTDKIHATLTAQLSSSSATTVLTVGPWLDTLALSNSTIAGGNTVQGTVTLMSPAPTGGIDVALSSSSPAAVVDSSVHVDEGTTSATFPITTGTVAGDTPSVITAQYENATRKADLLVRPAKIQTFTITPSRIAGGGTAVGTITLDGTSNGVNITFASNKAAVPAPALVNIPLGAKSATFNIPTNAVVGIVTATVTATLGTQNVNALLTVENTTISSFKIAPNSGRGGSVLVGTVTLGSTAQAATTVGITVSAGPAGAVTFPATVTVPVGSRSATFNITLTAVTVDTPVTLQAAVGANTATAGLTVLAPKITSVNISPSSVVGGAGNPTVSVTLDSPAPAGGLTVTLVNNDPVAAPVSNAFVAAGTTTSAAVSIQTTPVTVLHTVTFTATLPSGSKTGTLQVRPSSIGSIVFTPNKVQGGDPNGTTMTITLIGTAPAGGANVQLIASTGGVLTNLGTSKLIPAGSNSASFPVTVGKVSRNVVIKVTGTYGGASASGTITVNR